MHRLQMHPAYCKHMPAVASSISFGGLTAPLFLHAHTPLNISNWDFWVVHLVYEDPSGPESPPWCIWYLTLFSLCVCVCVYTVCAWLSVCICVCKLICGQWDLLLQWPRVLGSSRGLSCLEGRGSSAWLMRAGLPPGCIERDESSTCMSTHTWPSRASVLP